MALPGRRGQYRFGYVRGVKAGQRYGYRVHGMPQEGMLFDPDKLLIDPYARALSRAITLIRRSLWLWLAVLFLIGALHA